jgi:hypothetical protein
VAPSLRLVGEGLTDPPDEPFGPRAIRSPLEHRRQELLDGLGRRRPGRVEARLEESPDFLEVPLHGSGGLVKGGRDVRDRQIVEVAKDDKRAVRCVQTVERLLDDVDRVGGVRDRGRRRRYAVNGCAGEAGRLAIRGAQTESHPALGHQDPVEPGLEVARVIEVRELAPRGDDHMVGCVRRLRLVAEDRRGQAVGIGEDVHGDRVERARVAVAGASNQSRIDARDSPGERNRDGRHLSHPSTGIMRSRPTNWATGLGSRQTLRPGEMARGARDAPIGPLETGVPTIGAWNPARVSAT